jgi:L-gulonolactone oxidase
MLQTWGSNQQKWDKCYGVLLAVNLLFYGILLVPVLEIQVFAFALQAVARLLVFSVHHTYTLEKFGVEYFGMLNGVSAFVAATFFALFAYPLQLFSLYVAEGDFSVSLGIVSGAMVLSSAFPVLYRQQKVSNWAETAFVDPKKFVFPASVDELIALVKTLKKMRMAGAMHSCAPLIDCTEDSGKIVHVTHLNRILEIDVGKKSCRFEPGVTVHQLCEEAAKHGLAVGTLGTIDWQTIVGAVMTGTHGGSVHIPSLHTFMESYTVVKADGSQQKVSRRENPELFKMMAPSLGVHGVVVEAEMRCVPLQHLEARFETVSMEEMCLRPGKFLEVMHQNKYARVVIYPSIGKATIWTANPLDREGEAAARGAIKTEGYMNFRSAVEKAWLQEWLRLWEQADDIERLAQEEVDDGAVGGVPMNPNAGGVQRKQKLALKNPREKVKQLRKRAGEVLETVLKSQEKRLAHYEGQYNHVLCKERNHGIPHADMELSFDIAQADDVLKTFYDYQHKGNTLPYYNIEVRSTQQDDATLSAARGRDTMWIDFQACASARQQQFFGVMEDLFEHLDFRKHWAKGMDHMNPQRIMRQYPGLHDFMRTRKEFDPEGKFSNEHVDMFFGAFEGKDTSFALSSCPQAATPSTTTAPSPAKSDSSSSASVASSGSEVEEKLPASAKESNPHRNQNP